jgi:hypothetical protein
MPTVDHPIAYSFLKDDVDIDMGDLLEATGTFEQPVDEGRLQARFKDFSAMPG